MAKNNSTLIVGSAVFGIAGLIAGYFLANMFLKEPNQYYTLTDNNVLMEYPSSLANKINRPLELNKPLLVVDKCDYAELVKNGPIVAKMKDRVKITKDGKQYCLTKDSSFRVVSNSENNTVIEATTNKGNTVNLNVNRNDVTDNDNGVWLKVIDSAKNTGWVMEVNKPKINPNKPETKPNKPEINKPVVNPQPIKTQDPLPLAKPKATVYVEDKYVKKIITTSEKIESIDFHGFGVDSINPFFTMPHRECWGIKDNPVGQSVTITLKRRCIVPGIRISVGLPIKLGDRQSEIMEYGMPTKLRVYADDIVVGDFTFSDKERLRNIKFDKEYDADEIKVEILEYRPGTKHHITCIDKIGWG